jgi:PKD repeat protein
VDHVTANHQFQLEEPIKGPDEGQIEAVEPNITFVKAPDVWAMGFTGQGTVMAGNDTGLYWSHPALIRQYRGCQDPPTCSNIDHNFNWWDATGTYPSAPDDGHGHGTHTAGTMVGEDASLTNQVGVAPGARLVHCKNMDNGGYGNDAWFLTCFEWDLAPWDLNHNNPPPSLAPDAVNNSWGYGGGGQNQFRTAINNLQAAGVAVEVSAGNEGSGCQSLRSPGDYTEVLTTGSVNHAAPYPGTMTGFSSRGPSSLDGNYFPDITAPGENIRSSVPGGGYQGGWSGTSMAGPHATALIGLLWSACPAFQGRVAETFAIITSTASPVTSYVGSCGGDYVTGPNNDWGYGTIDALAAVQAILAQCGPAGSLEGFVYDDVTMAPIQGAQVTAASLSGYSGTDTTDATGYYNFSIIPADTYTVTAEHMMYTTAFTTGVEVYSGTVTQADLYLTPRGMLWGYVTDWDNGFPLEGATLTADDGTTATTDADGYYEMYLDEGTQDVTASMADYAPDTQTVTIVSGEDTQQDFQLVAAIAFLPSPLHVTVPWQTNYSEGATLTNRLPTAYDYVFGEEPGGFMPNALGTTQVTIPAGPDKAPAGTAVAPAYTPAPERTYNLPRYPRPEAGPNILLVAADDDNDLGSPIQGMLQAYGDLGMVDLYDARSATPSLAELEAYDIVVVWANYVFPDPVGMGNILADYVDAGGRVIDLNFAIDSSWGMQGRFVTENYTALMHGSTNYANSCLGTFDPNHPVMSDPTPVTNVCDLYRISSGGVTPGSTLVASWQDGQPFVGVKDDGSVVTINGYVGYYYQWTGQMADVLHNAILWMAVPPEVPWFGQAPVSGTVPAQSSVYPTMLFTATTAAGVTQPGDYWCTLNIDGDPDLAVLVTMTVEPAANMGRVHGYVVDHCTGMPVEEALVSITGGDPITQTMTDPDGYYSAWLYAGTYPFNFSADGYVDYDTDVTIVAGEVVTLNVDFFPDRPCMMVEPDTMSATLSWGDSATNPLTISNDGAVDLEFELQEMDRGWMPLVQPVSIPPSDGNFPRDNAPTSVGPAPNAPQYVAGGPGLPGILSGAPAYAVDVYPGYNLVYFESETPNPWTIIAPLPGNQYFAGDFINGDFSTLYVIDYGTNSLYAVDTTSGATTLIGPSPAYGGETWTGMTGAPDGTMYASSTNISRSTLYTVDLATGTPTVIGEITGAPAIIDIAYNTLDGFIYGVEIVNDVLVRIDPATGAGTVVGALGVSANYAQGMDFEEESGVLYWAAYTTQGELRILDPNTGASVLVGAFPSGAETDSLAFATGGAGADVPWLFEDPISGTVAPQDSFVVDVTMDSMYVAQPGVYWATLKVKSNDPENSSFPVIITMTVLPSDDMGRVGGTVYDNCTGEPLADVMVHIFNGVPITMTETGDDGMYAAWLISGTYDVEFTADGYLAYNDSVGIVAGEVTTLDVNLVPDRPCIAVDPDSFEVWVLTGTAVYNHPTGLDIINNGGQDLEYEISEISGTSLLGSPVLPAADNPGYNSTDVAAIPAVPTAPTQPQGTGVLLIQDVVPWGYTSIETILNNNGIPFTTIGSAQIPSTDFTPYKMIIVPSVQGTGYNNIYNANLAKFESFIEGGGVMLFNYCEQSSYTPYRLPPFGGANNYQTESDNYIVDPAHPIMAGVSNPYSGNSASHSYMTGLLPDDYILVTGGTVPGGNVVMIERSAGAGLLVAGGQTFEWGYANGQGAGIILANMIPYYYYTWQPGGTDVWWVWEDPISGTVPSLTATNVDIMFTALFTDATPMPLGTYAATMKVKNNADEGTQELPTLMHIVDQYISPTASFEHNAPVCDGTTVVFTDTSDPGVPAVISWEWDFGDGNTSMDQNPTHLYAAAGLYTVTLTVTQAQTGWTSTDSAQVEVKPFPEAGFTYAVNELEVTFTDASMNATSWMWYFGDGMTDTVASPVHTYDMAGTYTVTQIVSNDCGTVAVWALVTVGVAPEAGFTHNAPVCLGEPVVFTNTTTGTEPIWYLWDLGDGGTSTETHPMYLYTAAGTYTVTLDAMNDFGASQAMDWVEVLPLPAAAFTYTADGLDVTFVNLSQGADSYLWDLGDGMTSTLENPVHTYADAGTYDVSLEVTGVCGTDTAMLQVTVAPSAYYLYLPLLYKTAAP